MKILNRLFLLGLVLFLSGCDQLNSLFLPKKKAPPVVEAKPIVPMLEDTDLAKLILKPEPYKLKVTRDPFKPLIERKEALEKGTQEDAVLYQMSQEQVKKMKYLGLIKMADQYSALIKTEKRKGVYKLNDEVEGFYITGIAPDHVVLEKQNMTFNLKRGEK